MTDQFFNMDTWTSEQVAQFKEQAKRNQEKNLLSLEAVEARIVAEGDSWFDYLPGTDIIDCLRYYYGYVIDNYGKAGDNLENMIYGTEINSRYERVSPSIRLVLARLAELKPKIFLFSGGGNDVAGDEFESYLNHVDSGLPAVRRDYVEFMMSVFKKYYDDLIHKVAVVSPNTHIVTHGYGHTAPTGRGVDIVFTWSGPWLRPALARKGILDPTQQRQIVFDMINKFNALLADLSRRHPKFHHVDLRTMLNPDQDWENELHLRNAAYARVAQKINGVIKGI